MQLTFRNLSVFRLGGVVKSRLSSFWRKPESRAS